MTDMALTDREVRRLLSQACEMAGSQSEWARLHRIPVSVVSETVRGTRGASDSVLAAMGLMRVVRFIPTKRGSNGPGTD